MKKICVLLISAVLLLGLAGETAAVSLSFGYISSGVYDDPDWGIEYDLSGWNFEASQELTNRFTIGLEVFSGETEPVNYTVKLYELYGRYHLIQGERGSFSLVASYGWSDMNVIYENEANSVYAGAAFELVLIDGLSLNGIYQTAVWTDQDEDDYYPRIRTIAKLGLEFEVAAGVSLSAGYVYFLHCYVEPHFTYEGYQAGLNWSL